MRLDKYISDAAQKTRSEARSAILTGKVMVNAAVCKKADYQIKDKDDISLSGVPLKVQEFVYIMLNKPKGVVSAAADKTDKTVVDLVNKGFPRRNLFPAGRLDKASTGFVLVTDDGAFAHDILAPKKHVSKTYEVLLDTPLTDDMILGFAKGVTLADGTALAPAQLESIDGGCLVRVVLKQGVYHQIKRMFGVFEAGVNELKRVAIGGLKLDNTLKEGEYRQITKEELEIIKHC